LQAAFLDGNAGIITVTEVPDPADFCDSVTEISTDETLGPGGTNDDIDKLDELNELEGVTTGTDSNDGETVIKTSEPTKVEQTQA
jgi:hypothetical protein